MISEYPEFVYVSYDQDISAQTHDIAVSLEAGTLVGVPVKYFRVIPYPDQLAGLARYAGNEICEAMYYGRDVQSGKVGEYVLYSDAVALVASRVSETERVYKVAYNSCLRGNERLRGRLNKERQEKDYLRLSLEEKLNAERFSHEQSGKSRDEWMERAKAAEAENERLRVRLKAAADDFDLIQQRLKDGQHKRAEGTAYHGEREARTALITGKGDQQ